MVKAIILDLDNTLIDFMKMKQVACRSAVDAMIKAGLNADKKETLSLLFTLYDKYGYEYEHIFQALLKEMTGKIDYGIVGAGIVAYRKSRESLLIPYPGVKETIRKLKKKGMKLAIVTDAPRIQAWIRLAAMQMQGEFDVVVTFDDSRMKKPGNRPFLMALKKLKVRPEEILMVGDSIEKDVIPAKKLGMKTALAKYGISKNKIARNKEMNVTKGKIKKETIHTKPDFVLRRFSDILKIV